MHDIVKIIQGLELSLHFRAEEKEKTLAMCMISQVLSETKHSD